jgi:hypothetical protein
MHNCRGRKQRRGGGKVEEPKRIQGKTLHYLLCRTLFRTAFSSSKFLISNVSTSCKTNTSQHYTPLGEQQEDFLTLKLTEKALVTKPQLYNHCIVSTRHTNTDRNVFMLSAKNAQSDYTLFKAEHLSYCEHMQLTDVTCMWAAAHCLL